MVAERAGGVDASGPFDGPDGGKREKERTEQEYVERNTPFVSLVPYQSASLSLLPLLD